MKASSINSNHHRRIEYYDAQKREVVKIKSKSKKKAEQFQYPELEQNEPANLKELFEWTETVFKVNKAFDLGDYALKKEFAEALRLANKIRAANSWLQEIPQPTGDLTVDCAALQTWCINATKGKADK
jgi:cell division protein YceG involved in septum cleavage